MKENTSRGRREQLLHYPVYFNPLSVLRMWVIANEDIIISNHHIPGLIYLFIHFYFSGGGCRSSSEDSSHGSANTSEEWQRNQGPADHQRKRNQSDWYWPDSPLIPVEMWQLFQHVKHIADNLCRVRVEPLQSVVINPLVSASKNESCALKRSLIRQIRQLLHSDGAPDSLSSVFILSFQPVLQKNASPKW